MSQYYTWEEAVLWLREQPDQQELVKFCYYDDPLLLSCERFFLGEEWKAASRYLPLPPGLALDLGAGRGIGSYALAKNGWQVTALEPDPSKIVGAGAIRSLVEETGLSIRVVEKWGEKLPFDDKSFDLIYCRQALHHAADLPKFCAEAFRVLKPGGLFLATREHVISKTDDLQQFLDNHPLNFLYGGENAYILKEYLMALKNSGFNIENILGSFDTPINYFPLTFKQFCMACYSPISRFAGPHLTFAVANLPFLGSPLTNFLAHIKSRMDQTPGRLYTFACSKPGTRN